LAPLSVSTQGKADIAIGTVVGSSLLYPLVILGLCASVSGDGLGVDPVVITRLAGRCHPCPVEPVVSDSSRSLPPAPR
jgi:Ca2+/Na+ antiporter